MRGLGLPLKHDQFPLGSPPRRATRRVLACFPRRPLGRGPSGERVSDALFFKKYQGSGDGHYGVRSEGKTKGKPKMKAKLTIRWILSGVLSLGMLAIVTPSFGQPTLPDPPPNTNGAPTAEQIAAQQAALEATRQARYQQDFAPWLVKSLTLPDGTMLTETILQTQRNNALLALATNIATVYTQQQAQVSEYVRTNSLGMPASWRDSEGVLHIIDHMENGVPAIKSGFNVLSASTISANRLWPGGSTGLSLTGSNVFLGLWDQGDVLTNHVEFTTNGLRVRILDGVSPYGIDNHATHVCGTLAAFGVATNAKGLSHRSVVLANDFLGDQVEMPGTVVSNALRISNHSYGYNRGWYLYEAANGTNAYAWYGDTAISQAEDWHFGYYDDIAMTNDMIIYAAQTYLPVFSAGNERGTYERGPAGQPIWYWNPNKYPSPGWDYGSMTQPIWHYEFSNGAWAWSNATRPLDDAANGFDTLTSYAVSKNNLVVGAVNPISGGYAGSNSVVVGNFSSFGPTDDGRIKPDITADGVNVHSTLATNTSNYGNLSGTSMAAPAVTGTLGLLTELHQRFYGTNQPMLSSTLRGLVIHTADEAGTAAGPDYRFGWGLLNAQSAANLVTNNYLSQSLANIKEVRLLSGDFIEFPVISTSAWPLRVTICWTDPAGASPAVGLDRTNRMLVNDLDLRVISPNGTTNFPWTLSPASPANAATTGDNDRDNVEQVYLASPANGQYIVRVKHKGALVNDSGQTNYQNVSIIVSGNVVQPPIQPLFASMQQSSSNSIALKWNSEVGRVYRLQYVDDLNSTNWQYATSELSAMKTNTAASLSVGGVTTRFYRLLQVR